MDIRMVVCERFEDFRPDLMFVSTAPIGERDSHRFGLERRRGKSEQNQARDKHQHRYGPS